MNNVSVIYDWEGEGDDEGDAYTEGTEYENNEPIVIISNNNNQQTREEFLWTDATTRLLLSEYLHRKEAFRNPKIKKKELWMQIKAAFQKYSYEVTPDILDKKFRNLKQTYHRIKDSQNVKKRTGEASIRWQFFDSMDDIFYVDDNITSPTAPLESSNTSSCKATTPIAPLRNIINHVSSQLQVLPRAAVSRSSNDFIEDFSSLCQALPEASTSATPMTPKMVKKTNKTKARKNLLTYRSDLIQLEKDRVAAIKELKKSIDGNTDVMKDLVGLQKERNTLLERLANNN